MASPTIKSTKHSLSSKPFALTSLSLISRRCLAWSLEVGLLAASALVPYSVGAYFVADSSTEVVPLNSTLAQGEEAIAQTLSLPQQESPRLVPPLTNWFWGLAVATPLGIGGWQLLLLVKNGRTLPKRWLKIRVMTTDGKLPSLKQILLREGLGKWGLPMGLAYLVWRCSWTFPNLGGFLGLAFTFVLIEGGLLLLNRRPLHDYIAGTVVVDTNKRTKNRRPVTESVAVELPTVGEEPQLVQAIVVRAYPESSKTSLWLWMRQHPTTTLLGVSLLGMTGIMLTFVGTQVYIQSRTDERQSQEQKNQAFLSLVNQLTTTAVNPLDERKGLILAIARLDDHRSIPYLVDLLTQETNPILINTLQQAITTVGSPTLPALAQINQSLTNQLQSSISEREQQLIKLRLQATQQAIAQVLILHQGHLRENNLSRVNLDGQNTDFKLVLNSLNLSSLDFSGANLTGADFSQSQFSENNVGTNFQQATLQAVNFTNAQLEGVILNQANLMQANLTKANLAGAQLQNTNLSSAILLQADLKQANLTQASLTGADLGEANFEKANLQKANLGQVRAQAANFHRANLGQSNWRGSDLSSGDFSGANLQEANLSSVLLKGANLRNADLRNTNLSRTNLSQVDLRGANLKGANFQGVILAESKQARSDEFIKTAPAQESTANFQGVDFSEVNNLSNSQLELICKKGGYHPHCN